jgi:hypothetical protein
MALSEDLRLLSIRVLQNFVRETGGDWTWEQWQRLIQRLRRMGFAAVTEEHIRELCERNRTRWLSGVNSVEPPIPAVAEPSSAPLGGGAEEPIISGAAGLNDARPADLGRLAEIGGAQSRKAEPIIGGEMPAAFTIVPPFEETEPSGTATAATPGHPPPTAGRPACAAEAATARRRPEKRAAGKKAKKKAKKKARKKPKKKAKKKKAKKRAVKKKAKKKPKKKAKKKKPKKKAK